MLVLGLRGILRISSYLRVIFKQKKRHFRHILMKRSGILRWVAARRSNDSWKRRGHSILSADVTQILQRRSVLPTVRIKKDDHSQSRQACSGKMNMFTWKNEKLATSSSAQIVNKTIICANIGPAKNSPSSTPPPNLLCQSNMSSSVACARPWRCVRVS